MTSQPPNFPALRRHVVTARRRLLLLGLMVASACTASMPNAPGPTATVLVLGEAAETATPVPTVAASETPTVEPTTSTDTETTTEDGEPPNGQAEAAVDVDGWETAEDFDLFLETAYRAQLRRDPEMATELGLADALGMDNTELTDVSDAFQQETYALLQRQLDALHRFNRDALTPSQQLSYDLFAWHLDDQLAGAPYRFYTFPVKQLLGVHQQLLEFMTDRHPIENLADAEAYIARLNQFPTKIDQLLAWMDQQKAVGIILPQFAISSVQQQLVPVIYAEPTGTTLYTTFESRLMALEDVDADRRAQLPAAAEEAIADQVQPSYSALHDYILDLRGSAPEEGGLSRLPDGDAAYAYLLSHYTTTDLTADEIHEIGLQEVARIRAEMIEILDDLNIRGANLGDRMNRVMMLSSFVSGDNALDLYRSLITDAEARLNTLFAMQPEANVVVMPIDAPGFSSAYYAPSSLDGSRSGAFYVGLGGQRPRATMPTLTYHETLPGHHFQIALAREQTDLPTFRRATRHTVFSEGWALYAERLAYEAGWYEGDPYGNLGRLQDELFRAARLVADTGIHAYGWTREEAVTYMVEEAGLPEPQARYEVNRYVVMPGQATSYKIGMLKILELREAARTAHQEAFDIKAFHNLILLEGSTPLEMLERHVVNTLETE